MEARSLGRILVQYDPRDREVAFASGRPEANVKDHVGPKGIAESLRSGCEVCLAVVKQSVCNRGSRGTAVQHGVGRV